MTQYKFFTFKIMINKSLFKERFQQFNSLKKHLHYDFYSFQLEMGQLILIFSFKGKTYSLIENAWIVLTKDIKLVHWQKQKVLMINY